MHTDLTAERLATVGRRQDLRDCLHRLAEIVGGEITTEETLQNIFKHFCIGK